MTAIVVALIAAVGTYVTARPALADVGLKRRLDTAERFASLAETANNVDGSTGLYEQVAAIHLIASFGNREIHLRDPAHAVLSSLFETRDNADDVSKEAKKALDSMDEWSRFRALKVWAFGVAKSR